MATKNPETKKPETKKPETKNPETAITARATSAPVPVRMSEAQKALSQYAPELQKPGVTLVDELDGTWAKEASPVIVGTISHAYGWEATNDETGEVKQMYGVAVKTRNPVVCNVDSGVDELAPGSKVGITLGEKLTQLIHMRPGDVIAVEYLGKAQLKGGKTCGRYRVEGSALPRKTPMLAAQQLADEDANE